MSKLATLFNLLGTKIVILSFFYEDSFPTCYPGTISSNSIKVYIHIYIYIYIYIYTERE